MYNVYQRNAAMIEIRTRRLYHKKYNKPFQAHTQSHVHTIYYNALIMLRQHLAWQVSRTPMSAAEFKRRSERVAKWFHYKVEQGYHKLTFDKLIEDA